MEDREHRKRLDKIYLTHDEAITNATNDRDLAIRTLNDEYNKTRGKK